MEPAAIFLIVLSVIGLIVAIVFLIKYMINRKGDGNVKDLSRSVFYADNTTVDDVTEETMKQVEQKQKAIQHTRMKKELNTKQFLNFIKLIAPSLVCVLLLLTGADLYVWHSSAGGKIGDHRYELYTDNSRYNLYNSYDVLYIVIAILVLVIAAIVLLIIATRKNNKVLYIVTMALQIIPAFVLLFSTNSFGSGEKGSDFVGGNGVYAYETNNVQTTFTCWILVFLFAAQAFFTFIKMKKELE